jgi:hypothetical protein
MDEIKEESNGNVAKKSTLIAQKGKRNEFRWRKNQNIDALKKIRYGS